MRRHSRVFFVLLLLCATTAVAQENPDIEVEPTSVAAIRDAAVHSGPSPNARVITAVRKGTPLLVIGHSYGWMRVTGPDNLVGWISRELLGNAATVPGETFALSAIAVRSAAKEPCAANVDDACPTRGCATDAGDQAINERKRHQVTGTGATRLTLDDFLTLQKHCLTDPDPVGEGATPSAHDRKTKLRNLKLKSGRAVGEGDSVMLAGYVVGEPDAPGPESVNCYLKTKANEDFHINIAASSRTSVYHSIVVEMIPQKRSAGWTTEKLRVAQKSGFPVFVSGQLLYDSKHFVNATPGVKGRSNQPKRFSLWEIHPIRGFLVCPTRDCNMGDPKGKGWMKLADWTP